jgi:hypothetical protein
MMFPPTIDPFFSNPPRERQAGIDRRGKRSGMKPDCGKPCPSCRVTLSKGRCLNRMCKEFVDAKD